MGLGGGLVETWFEGRKVGNMVRGPQSRKHGLVANTWIRCYCESHSKACAQSRAVICRYCALAGRIRSKPVKARAWVTGIRQVDRENPEDVCSTQWALAFVCRKQPVLKIIYNPNCPEVGHKTAMQPEPTTAMNPNHIRRPYRAFMELKLDGWLTLASNPENGHVVAIRVYQLESCYEGIARKLMEYPHPNITGYIMIDKPNPSQLIVYQDHMDVTLKDLFATPLRLRANEVATICNEVRRKPPLADRPAKFP